jgi:CheY-like chemotaxis protein
MHSSLYKRSSAYRGKHQSAADLLSKATEANERQAPGACLSLGSLGHSTPSIHPNYGGLQILVAEDNDINVKICTKILEHVGGRDTNIHVVCDGRQVLCALERNPTYDLVLMDIHMPDMDGIEAAKELRRRGVQCPIVALSADSTVHDECLAAGMRAFLRKPLKVTDVQDLLKSL